MRLWPPRVRVLPVIVAELELGTTQKGLLTIGVVSKSTPWLIRVHRRPLKNRTELHPAAFSHLQNSRSAPQVKLGRQLTPFSAGRAANR